MAGRTIPTRPPLTTEQLEQLSADDFVRLKLTADEKARLIEINRMRAVDREARTHLWRDEEKPIIHDLHQAGVSVSSLWDLVNTSTPYPKAIPVLLKHLLYSYSDRVREGIARALAVKDPQVRNAWKTLVEEYLKAPFGNGVIAPGDSKEFRLGAKSGLACALAVAVTEDVMPDLIALIRDRTNGESRVLLLSALRKSKSSIAHATIRDVANDPELEKEIFSWPKQVRDLYSV